MKSANSIYLMLGDACNFNCRHCIQSETDVSQAQIPLEFKVRLLNKILEYSQREKFKSQKLKVFYWGGEPLVYWKDIVLSIGILQNSVEHVIITNGSLLTDEKISFLNAFSVRVVISHDGINTSNVRQIDILSDPKIEVLLKKIEFLSVDAIVTAHNQSFKELWDFWNSIIPDINIFTEFLQVSHDMPKDIYNFDFEEFESEMRQICDTAIRDFKDKIFSNEVRVFLNTSLQILKNEVLILEGKPLLTHPKCNQIRNALNIDWLGNVYACHNSKIFVGDFDSPLEELVEKHDKKIAPYYSAVCEECKFNSICRGGCPFTDKHSVGQQRVCEILRIFYAECVRFSQNIGG